MDKPTVRIGLIGAGYVADIHARSYAHVARDGEGKPVEAELVAVAASSSESAARFARTHGIPAAYDDYRRILARDDVDAVDVCTPNELHESIVVAAARAGKHALCEKPLTGYFGGPGAATPVGATPRSWMRAAALRSVDRMIGAARGAGVTLGYAENWVYCPAIQRALGLAQASGGTVLEIRAEESHSGSHARYAKEWARAGGGSLMRLAPHPIGAALHFKAREGMWRDGRPIRASWVTAEVARLDRVPSFLAEDVHWVVDDWVDVENWCEAIIGFEDGTRAVVHAADVSLGGIETPFEVRMSTGRIVCNVSHSGAIRAFAPDPGLWGDAYLMEKADHRGGWSYPSVDEHWMLGYPHEMADFCGAVAYDRAPISTVDLGREVVDVIYAAYQSAEEGRRIDLRREGGA
ncbi:MAG: Gfo/Idh/MocA family oxidoreductase [Anaerolineae bacterium]|nr:Gfo/Idh/MocA family oxidoreductase [Anaerolineae bacterium]